jgi:hypothetical protein
MPDRVTTSFIPKESLMSDRTPRSPRRSPLVFLNLIAGAILILALLAAGGVFLLKTYTEQSIISKKESIDRQRAAFEPATIEELLRLDKRINASYALLKGHTALSLVFSDLEGRTVQNVRFRDFKYEPAGPGKFSVTMSGTAKSFNAVALQSDSFGKSDVIKDPIFANLNLDQNGDVIFDFTAVVDPARISYATIVAGAIVAPTIEDVVPTAEPDSIPPPSL